MSDNSNDYQFYRVDTIDNERIVTLGEDEIEEGIETVIEYKKLTSDNFPNQGYDIIVEDEIEVNEQGYIEYEVFENIKNNEIDETVIINAGTGQGKTYNTFKLIEEYQNNYIIVIAVPFLSLADKYYDRVLDIEGITKNDVVNSKTAFDGELTEQEIESLSKRKIHIITINLLLGNPGESTLLQSRNKLNYIDKLIAHANSRINEESSTSKNVIWLFDEIHEGVHNFKTNLIYNLFKWRNLIHKTYILSATFTESAIIVIRYLSELTSYKIRIVNTKRSRNPIERQAELFLLITQGNYGSSENNIQYLYPLIPYIELHLSFGDSINILSYSKNLAVEIVEGENDITKLLKGTEQGINLLTSKTDVNFDEDAINIGTTFKTGIDITSSNSLYIIIAPTSTVAEGLMQKGQYGIFSDGIPAILQSIARLRNGGTIIAVIPRPQTLIEGRYLSRLPTHAYFTTELTFWNRLPFTKQPKRTYEEQKSLLINFYEEQKRKLQNEIDYVESQDRTYLPYLTYPTLDTFIRDEGQFYLTGCSHSYGASIYPYIIWASYHNQFSNAQLKGFLLPSKRELHFTTENLFNEIEFYLGFHEISPDELPYHSYFIRGAKSGFPKMTFAIISDVQLFLDEKKLVKWYSKPFFAMTLFQVYAIYSNRILSNEYYSETDYILDQIIVAQNTTEQVYQELHENEQSLIGAYKSLGSLRNRFIDMANNNESDKLYNNFENEQVINLDDDFFNSFKYVIENLMVNDVFVKNKVLRKLKVHLIAKKIEEDQTVEAYKEIYKFFIKLSLIVEKRTNGKLREYRDENNKRKFKVLGIRPLPQPETALNFLYTPILPDINEEQEVTTL